MKITSEKLHKLIKHKLIIAGLNKDHAEDVAECLVYADERGFHSHGAMRVEYYCERIAKSGINTNPNFEFKTTGPSSGVYEGDNGIGFVAAKNAMKEAISMAKESGVAIVGVKRMSHSGSLGYFVEMAVKENLIAISLCQSDPMAVPYGGSEVYYGTNPIAFGAPSADERKIIFDMATTIQAWGKILDAKVKGELIPKGWAVDKDGNPTTDPKSVHGLLPIAGPKGSGLMMMVDILSGVLLGLPFGKHVSSMYDDLSKGRDLGQLHIVIDPGRFTNIDTFKHMVSQTLDELKEIKPASGFNEVNYPGERELKVKATYNRDGIEIADDVYDYLVSGDIHYNHYENKNRFGE